jgi:hypothetical protein
MAVDYSTFTRRLKIWSKKKAIETPKKNNGGSKKVEVQPIKESKKKSVALETPAKKDDVLLQDITSHA